MQEYIPRAYFRWLCNSLNSSFSSLLSATILCMCTCLPAGIWGNNKLVLDHTISFCNARLHKISIKRKDGRSTILYILSIYV